MTTKTDITLPEPAFKLRWHDDAARYTVSVPNIGDTDCYTADQVRAAVEADRQGRASCISNLSESDKQDHIGDATGMVPSDEEILDLWRNSGPMLGSTNFHLKFARALLSRYSSCQPAASATPSDDDLLGCAGVSTNGGLPSIVGTADIRRFADCVRKHWGQIVGSVAQEPVGVVNMAGPMYVHGTTIVTFEAEKVPVGTKLYAAPVVAQAQPLTTGQILALERRSNMADDEAIRFARSVQSALSGQPSAQDREDAERYRWATALDDNSETLHSIVLSYGGDQAKINERVDVYRACDARAAKGADHD